MAIELYHCAPLPLSPGSVICPGNWGRIKRRFEQNALSLLREAVLDDIRRREFATKPSRLDAGFACPTIVDVEQYRAKHAPTGLIYKVELLEPSALSHSGDHELYLQGFVGIDGMEELARRYWRSESLGGPEILTLSPMRVIECIDSTCPTLTGLKSSRSEIQATG
jgi:hypothetical protein